METNLKLEETCAKCSGTGKIGSETCQLCQGRGTVLTETGRKVLNYLRDGIKSSEH